MIIDHFIKPFLFITSTAIVFLSYEKFSHNVLNKFRKNCNYNMVLLNMVCILLISVITPTPRAYNAMYAGFISNSSSRLDAISGLTAFYKIPNLINYLNAFLFQFDISSTLIAFFWKLFFSTVSYFAFYNLAIIFLTKTQTRAAFALTFTISTGYSGIFSDTYPVLYVWDSSSVYGFLGFILIIFGVAFFIRQKLTSLSVVSLLCSMISPTNALVLIIFLILLSYREKIINHSNWYFIGYVSVCLSIILQLVTKIFSDNIFMNRNSLEDLYRPYVDLWDFHRSDQNYTVSNGNLLLLVFLMFLLIFLTLSRVRFLERWQLGGLLIVLALAPSAHYLQFFPAGIQLSDELKRIMFLRLSLVGIPILIISIYGFIKFMLELYKNHIPKPLFVPSFFVFAILSAVTSNPIIGDGLRQFHADSSISNPKINGSSVLVFPGFTEEAIWNLSLLPVINTENGLDFIPYIKGSEQLVEEILLEGYGVSLANPPYAPHCGCLPNFKSIKETWEMRNFKDWASISHKLNFELVLAPDYVNLDLTPVATYEDFTVYRIRKNLAGRNVYE